MSDILDRPKVTEDIQSTDDDSHASVSHYVKKTGLVNAMVDGEYVEGICGVVFIPYKDPKALPVCQGCKDIYETFGG